MLELSGVLHTNGRGYWSEQRRAVPITHIRLGYTNDEGTFGELRVYFDTAEWSVNNDGLIYTDPQFLRELRELLNSEGLPGSDANYSEAGMQGDDYVSLDVGESFIRAYSVLA